MRTIKAIFFTIVVLMQYTVAQAQPTEEDNVAFIYATGERTDNKLKVLIIGTHIMGFKGLNTPLNDGVHVKYVLGFSEVLDDIEYTENVSGLADYHNIAFNSPVVEDITSYIHPTYRQKYGIRSSDSKLAALEKIRKGVLDEYSSKGYKIYQIAFDPTDYDNFQYYENGTWLPYEYVKRSPISPLWIAYYRKGEIRSMVESLGGFETTTSTSSEDPDKLKRQAQLAQYNAGLVEAEANRLYDMGALFYPQALEKYKEANSIFPSAHSQSRIEYIESMYALGDALNQAGESLDNAVYTIDPMEETRFVYGYVNYTGVALNQSDAFADPSVFSGSFGFSAHRLFLSLDFKMGYMHSPIYEYHLTKRNDDNYFQDIPTGETVRIQNAALHMSWGVGVNIPIKPVLLYGLYGADMMIVPLKANVFSEGIENYDGIPSLPSMNWKYTIGTIFNIPKTKLAVGVQLNFNKIKGETENNNSQMLKTSDPDTRYYLTTTTDAEYKYQNLGFSFLWRL